MTDRVRSLTVVLDSDTRTDDAAELARVLCSIKGIASVTAGPVVDMTDWSARMAVGVRVGRVLYDLAGAVMSGKTVRIVTED